MIRFLPPEILAMLLVVAALSVADSGEDRADIEAAPTPTCLDGAIEAIQSRYDLIDDLRADFEQVTRTAALAGRGSSVTGTVSFAKPDKMRWSYADPPSLLVSDGRTLWIYDPAFKEVQKLSVGSSQYLSGASIQFLLGERSIRRDFSVVERGCTVDSVDIDLTPIEPATFERLAIVVDRNTGDLIRTTIYDLLGNVTEVTFSNLRTDLSPPPETFRFDPPAGVKVLEIGGNPQ
ncbi:MAG: outer membrane lipoprotein carrier protein LolA [Myxococcota bacterium]